MSAERIRVLFVIDKLHRAGAQVHLARLIERLDPRRFEPRVCCLISAGPVAEGLQQRGIAVDVLGMSSIYGPRAWRALGRLVRLCRRHRVQVIHTYLISANLFGTLAGRLAGVPAIVTSRRDLGFSRNWRLQLAEEWLVNPFVQRVTAVCAAAATEARRERGLANGKVVTIPNGIDTHQLDPEAYSRADARAEWSLTDDETAIGVIGHLSSPVKGQADFLRAAAQLGASRRVRIFIIGDGALRPALEAQARASGIEDRVVFTGVRADVPHLLAMLDLVVLPSHTEGLSNALLESMAMARPVIATAVGGNVDVVRDGVTGLLVPPRDPAALAAAMMRLLSDPAEARRLGAEARRSVTQNFDIHTMVSRYECLYRDLLAA